MRNPVQSPSKPILLLGGSGMLGRAWSNLLSRSEVPYIAPTREIVDLESEDSIRRMFKRPYSVVINCAAYTDVDGAEADVETAWQINAYAVAVMADCCRAADVRFVHHSTDYVFDGRAGKPYARDAACNPINAYGRSKLAGEVALANSACRHLILRTSWLYAPWGKNFVKTIADLVVRRPSLTVVDDQEGRPTSVESLASIGWELLQRECEGIFHVTDAGSCSWYDFAVQIRDFLQADCDLQAIKTSDLNRPARRPHYSVLDISATEKIVGPAPCWKFGVDHALRRLNLNCQTV